MHAVVFINQARYDNLLRSVSISIQKWLLHQILNLMAERSHCIQLHATHSRKPKKHKTVRHYSPVKRCQNQIFEKLCSPILLLLISYHLI